MAAQTYEIEVCWDEILREAALRRVPPMQLLTSWLEKERRMAALWPSHAERMAAAPAGTAVPGLRYVPVETKTSASAAASTKLTDKNLFR
jgi:hypothetical protein